MYKKRIFITGGTGYVGQVVLRNLIDKGLPVNAIWNRNCPTEKQRTPDVRWHHGSILDKNQIFQASQGCTIFIHLVGILSESQKKDITHSKVVEEGTRNIIEIAQAVGAEKIIYVSAAGTHSKSISKYHRSKWTAEETVRNSGIPWVIFRPSMLFGPVRSSDGSLRTDFVSDYLSKTKFSPFFPIPGHGKSLWTPLSVYDLAKAIVTSIEVNENLTVEAGGPETFTYGHLLRNIGQKSSPNKPILKIPFNFLWLAAFAVLERLPSVLLTRDQILMLQQDNIALPLSDSICSSGHLRSWNNAIDEYLK